MTTHVFRKTAATLLDEGGLPVREIADQLGHRRVSITQDTYFGRRHATPKVAAVLDVIGREAAQMMRASCGPRVTTRLSRPTTTEKPNGPDQRFRWSGPLVMPPLSQDGARPKGLEPLTF